MKTKERFFINDAIAKSNKVMLSAAILFFGIGLIAVWSADYSPEILGDQSIKQPIWTVFGLFFAFVFTLLNHKMLAVESFLKTVLIVFSALLAIIAYCAIFKLNLNIGPIEVRKINGAYRWYNLWGVGFQPSVFVKVILILFAALKLSQSSVGENKSRKVLKRNKAENNDFLKKSKDFSAAVWSKYKEVFVYSAIILLCIWLQPSNSVLISLFVILLAMFALKNSKFLIAAIFLAFIIIAAWNITPYFQHRFGGDTYQNEQAILAISSGGWFGQGLGLGEHKYPGRLPEIENDFIFALFAQEGGFIVSLLFLLVYAVFITTGFLTALDSQDEFSKLTAFGITVNYAFSFLLHFYVNLGFLNTGSSLPFVSYGGTAIIADAIMLGILLNISSSNKRYERIRQ
jgi:cell division protein FtsW